MANQLEERTLFGYEIDEGSINRVVSGTERVDKVVNKFEDDLGKLGPIGRRVTQQLISGIEELGQSGSHLNAIEDDFDKLEEAVWSYYEALERANAEQDELNQKPVTTQDRFDAVSKDVALAGDFQSNLGAVRGLAGVAGLGGAGEGIGIIGEVVALAEELPRLKVAAQGLPQVIDKAAAALGTSRTGLIGGIAVAGIAIASFSVLTSELSKQTARIADQTRARLDAERSAADFISQATRDSLEEARDQTVIDLALERQRLQQLQSEGRALSFDTLFGFFTQGRAGIDQLAGGEMKEVTAEVEETRAAIAGLETDLELYNVALDENATYTTDAAAAERELAAAREEATSQLIGEFEQETRLRLELAQLRRTGSSEQIRDRLIANQEEAAILENFLIPAIEGTGDTTEAAAQKLAEYRARVGELRHEDELLIAAVLPVIEAREREAEALEATNTQYENYMDLLTQEGEIRDDMAKILEESGRALIEHEEKIAKIRDDEQQALDLALTERIGARTDAEDKADADRRKALDDHLKKLRQINDNYERDSRNAIANRDAVAFDQAEEKYRTELKTEEEAYEDRLKQIDDALEAQYKVIDDRYKKELQRIEAASRQALDAEYRRYNDEQRIRQQAYTALEQQLIATWANQERIARDGSGGLVQIQTDHFNQLNILTAQGLLLLQNQFADFFDNEYGSGGGGGGGGGGPILPTPYSTELRPLPGTSVPQRQSAGPAGPTGFSYNPTYSIEAGMSRSEIKTLVSRQVDDDLDSILDMIGAPP